VHRIGIESSHNVAREGDTMCKKIGKMCWLSSH